MLVDGSVLGHFVSVPFVSFRFVSVRFCRHWHILVVHEKFAHKRHYIMFPKKIRVGSFRFVSQTSWRSFQTKTLGEQNSHGVTVLVNYKQHSSRTRNGQQQREVHQMAANQPVKRLSKVFNEGLLAYAWTSPNLTEGTIPRTRTHTHTYAHTPTRTHASTH